MSSVGSTKDNLKAAISGENYEFMTMYPDFIEQARGEGNKKAESSFNFASIVERIHYNMYQRALEALEAGKTLKDEPYYVCQFCGNTVAGEAPEKCPICGAPRKMFKKVD